MEVLLVFIVIGGIAALVFTGIRSRQAKKQFEFVTTVPGGTDLATLQTRIISGLPGGWHPLGSGGVRDHVVTEPAANFINVACGGAFRPVYALGVNLTVDVTDEHGFAKEVGFNELPPQAQYNAHIWVYYASKGQGRMWGPLTSRKIIALERYLCTALNTSYEQVMADAR